jgi:hypothetical protein
VLVVRPTTHHQFASRVLPGPDPLLMDRLARKYTGLSRHPLARRDSPGCAIVRVSVERIAGLGPWVDHTRAGVSAA